MNYLYKLSLLYYTALLMAITVFTIHTQELPDEDEQIISEVVLQEHYASYMDQEEDDDGEEEEEEEEENADDDESDLDIADVIDQESLAYYPSDQTCRQEEETINSMIPESINQPTTQQETSKSRALRQPDTFLDGPTADESPLTQHPKRSIVDAHPTDDFMHLIYLFVIRIKNGVQSLFSSTHTT